MVLAPVVGARATRHARPRSSEAVRDAGEGMEPSNGRGAEAGARAREDAREERAPLVGKFGRADWDAADDGETGAGTSDAKARDGGGNVDRSVARRRADAEGGDTATSSESEAESDAGSSSSSSSSSISSSSARVRVAARGRARSSSESDPSDSARRYDVEGRLPPRAVPHAKDGEKKAFWTNCYQEGMKFCGLGVLLEDVPESSSDDDVSDSDSDASRERRHWAQADTFKSTFTLDTDEDINDDIRGMVEEEEKIDLYPSPTIMDFLFNKMKARLEKRKEREKLTSQHTRELRMSLLKDRRKRRAMTWMVHRVVESRFFTLLTSLMITYSAVVLGIVAQSPTKWENSKFEEVSFLVLNVAFGVEILLRMLASGETIEEDGVSHLVKFRPHHYFHDIINVFDFTVTILSYLEYAVSGDSQLDAVRTLRLVRLLRVLRSIEDMRMILDAVIQGLTNIVWILMLLCVVMYIYAVFGVVFFGENDPRNFRDLGTAFKNVISMTTMADWMDFLYINYYGCDVYGYSGSHASYCTKPKAQKVLASVYITTLIITLGNIMMSLFIGVITNRMEEATLKLKETKEEKALKKEAVRIDAIWEEPGRLPYVLGRESHNHLMRHLNLLSGVRREGEALPMSKLPAWKHFQLSVRRLVVHPIFEWLIVSVILAAAITSGVNSEGSKNAAKYDDLQDAFLLLFAVELGVRFFAHFDKNFSFFTGKDKWWNIFDTIVVAVGLVPSNLNQAATVIRLIRLLRILRLVRVIRQLQVVVLSLLQGLKSIIYVAAFMVIVYFVYAVAAVQLYRENDPFHFRSLSNAMVTLFLVSFLEEWRPVFDINYNGCNINEYGKADGGAYYAEVTEQAVNMCTRPGGQKVFSILFFVSYILISAMVLVSAFVGIVVTSMQSASEQVHDRLAARERILSVQHYFSLTDESVKRSGEVFDLLNAGFSEELTAQMLLDKCKLLGIPTNEDFLRLTYTTVNGLTDKPFDKGDFILLTALAERAKIIQEKLANEEAAFVDDLVDDADFVEAHRTASGRKVQRPMN